MSNCTLTLSVPALRYAVEICEATPMYRVAIVLRQPDIASSTLDSATDFVDMMQYQSIQTTKDGRHSIIFKNGSKIQIVFPDESTRCYHFNLMIFDSELSDKEKTRAQRRWLRG